MLQVTTTSRLPIRQRVKCWRMWPPAVSGSNQAVAAAKEAFPKWANLPMKERARLMRRLGDLIDQNVRRSPRWKPRHMGRLIINT
ncbi:aldehyde dehydrogenase family protein [Escherichia coli]